jgi:hypothetical protein
MTEMSDLMRELACAVRQHNFEAADDALTVIAARHGYSGSIARGRRQAAPHEPTLLSVPNVVTIHDLPSRDGIVVEAGFAGVQTWRPAA